MAPSSSDLPPHLRQKQQEVLARQAEQDAAAARAAARKGGAVRMNLGWLRLWIFAGLVLPPVVATALIFSDIAPPPGQVSLILGASFLLPLLFGFGFGLKSVFDFVTATYFTGRRTKQATGLVTSTELEKRPGKSGWLYRPRVQFTFEADGATVEREFNPTDHWHNIEEWHQATLAKYPVGSTLTILWDPEAPVNSLPDLPPRSRWFGRLLFYVSALGLGVCAWLLSGFFSG